MKFSTLNFESWFPFAGSYTVEGNIHTWFDIKFKGSWYYAIKLNTKNGSLSCYDDSTDHIEDDPSEQYRVASAVIEIEEV